MINFGIKNAHLKIIPELDAAIKKYSAMMNLNASAGNPAERSRMITTMLKKVSRNINPYFYEEFTFIFLALRRYGQEKGNQC